MKDLLQRFKTKGLSAETEKLLKETVREYNKEKSKESKESKQ